MFKKVFLLGLILGTATTYAADINTLNSAATSNLVAPA